MLENAQSSLVRFLRWSEKYTKTDMVYLAHGSFWSVVAQVAAALSSLFLAIIVSRYLPKDIYGEYKYILSIVTLLGALSLTGLPGAVFTSVAHGFDRALIEGFRENIRWSIGIFLGALVLAVYYFFSHNYDLAFGILIGGCLSPFIASYGLAGPFISAKKDFARQTIYFGIIGTVVPVLALVATILVTKSALALVAAYFVSNLLVGAFLYLRVVWRYRPAEQKADGGMLSYGKHLSAMSILTVIANNIDQILLFHYVGAAQLALYNFATAIPDQAKGPLKTFSLMTQARFAERSTHEIRHGMRNKVVILFISWLAITALYIVLAPLVFWILFPNYMDAVVYSQIYAVSMLVFALDPGSSYLTIKKKIKEQYISNTVFAVVQILAMFVGVVWGGLIGLVIARVVTRFFGSGFTYALYHFSAKSATE